MATIGSLLTFTAGKSLAHYFQSKTAQSTNDLVNDYHRGKPTTTLTMKLLSSASSSAATSDSNESGTLIETSSIQLGDHDSRVLGRELELSAGEVRLGEKAHTNHIV